MHFNTILSLFLLASCFVAEETAAAGTRKQPKAIIRTCSCSLGKFHDLKEFLENDLPEYGDRMEVKYEQNAVPKIALFDAEGNENGLIMIEKFSRKQIREVLKEIGIEPYFTLEDLAHSEEL